MDGHKVHLNAFREDISNGHSCIRFEWKPDHLSFFEILQQAGLTPLPPYMNRPSEEEDKIRYQTIYAQSDGSVAAPAAGLHFTEEVLKSLKEKNISTNKVTLHVGAGTFKPVSTENIGQHEMHTEKIVVPKLTIQHILNRLNDKIILVGTTTVRTIESLYWHGVKLLTENIPDMRVDIKQWDPYKTEYNQEIDVSTALEKILEMMKNKQMDVLTGQTQLMIVPGYKYRIADIIITNFHMPKSTLLLLVSAFIGKSWNDVYSYALENDFRFLSYGDSCLFFKKE
ncbi:MAG: S-adenosylmethionine:tRNA ribosyltransferase-isomerase [Bacteroidales bacterium]